MNVSLSENSVSTSAANSALREGPLSLVVSGSAHVTAVVFAFALSAPFLAEVNPPNGSNVVSLQAEWLSTGEAAFDSAAAMESQPVSIPLDVQREPQNVEVATAITVEVIDAAGETVASTTPATPTSAARTSDAPQTTEPVTAVRLAKQSTASPPAVSAAATGLQIDVQPGKTFAPTPVYPPEALAAKLQGVVKLRVKIANDGTVSDARIDESSGHALLDVAAVEAVRQWRFTPALVRGIPVATEVRIPIRFQLQK